MKLYQQLYQYGSRRYVEKSIHISLKNKYIYVQNAKVASTTIKRTMIENEVRNSIYHAAKGNKPDKNKVPLTGIHDRAQSPLLMPEQLPEELFQDIFLNARQKSAPVNMESDFFIFTFVRNPFVRLLSAYLDKIVGESHGRGRLSIYKKLDCEPNEIISFADFVKVVVAENPRKADQHWRRQTYSVFKPVINYSFVGKLENFDQDFAYALSLMFAGQKAIDGEQKKNIPHKTNSASKLLQYYENAGIINSVREYYKDDFEAFEYPLDLPV